MANKACDIYCLALYKVCRPSNKTKPSWSLHADVSDSPAPFTATHPASHSLSRARPTVKVCQINTQCL